MEYNEFVAACTSAYHDGRRNKVESALGILDRVPVSEAIEKYVAKLIKNRERKKGANPKGRNSHAENSRLVLSKLTRELGVEYLDELTAVRVTAYMDASPLSSKTLRNQKSNLDGLCTFARTQGWLSSDPLELLESPSLPPGTIQWVKLEDFPRVLEAIRGKSTELPIALAGLAGIRRCEIVRLAPSDVLWKERHVHIRPEVSKTNRARYVPMSPTLEEVINRCGQKFGPFLCISPRKKSAWHLPALTTAAKRALRKSGIKTEPCGMPLVKAGVFNTLRHGAITYWLHQRKKNGDPIHPYEVAGWAGNSVAVIEKHYGAHVPRPQAADDADFLKTLQA